MSGGDATVGESQRLSHRRFPLHEYARRTAPQDCHGRDVMIMGLVTADRLVVEAAAVGRA